MEFVSLQSYTRKSKAAKEQATKPPIYMVQRYAKSGEKYACEFTIRLSEEMQKEGRLKIGDQVDIGYCESQQMWRVVLIDKPATSRTGYKICYSSSATKVTGPAFVRFTFAEGMPTFAPIETNKVTVGVDESTISFAAGQIVFGLDLKTLHIEPEKK